MPDVHPTGCFRAGPCPGRQSDREAVYRAALDQLSRAGLVYGCDCSRRARAATTPAATAGGGRELRYPGTCRQRGLPPADGYGWRLRVEDGQVAFEDGFLGPQIQQPSEQCGDMLLRDRLGNWTYQFAAAVDDLHQGVRPGDPRPGPARATGRQIYLAALLGRTQPPVFMHHPLIMKSPEQKLSKSDGDTGIRNLRAAGLTAAQVIEQAALAVTA